MSDECTCDCHKPGHVIMHMVQCCEQCPTCGKRIALERLADHEAACGGRVQASDPAAGVVDIEALLVAALTFYAAPASDGGALARQTLTQIQLALAEMK